MPSSAIWKTASARFGRLCDQAVAIVKEVAEPEGHEVIVQSIDSDEAKEYGLTSVPSVVKDGQVIFTRMPSREEATAAFVR